MKKIILFLAIGLWLNLSHTQTDPTLSVGLETLTYGKGTIDVELLTEIILEKQKELKQEALKRFMFNLFPEGNYTTKFYMQNALHILLNEKNPDVIKRELMEILTNYSLALGFTVAYKEIHPDKLKKVTGILNTAENISSLELNDLDNYLKSTRNSFLFFKKAYKTPYEQIKDIEGDLEENNISEEIKTFLLLKHEIEKEYSVSEYEEVKELLKNYKDKPFKDVEFPLKTREELYNTNNALRKAYEKRNKNKIVNIILTSESSILKAYIEPKIEKTQDGTNLLERLSFDELIRGVLYEIFKVFEPKNQLSELKITTDTIYKTIEAFKNSNLENQIKLLTNHKAEATGFGKINEIIQNAEINKNITVERDELYSLYNLFKSEIRKERRLRNKLLKRENKIKDRRFRRGVDDSFRIEIGSVKHEIEFDLLLDIVTTSLSENRTLQEKGFFKQKLDFTNSSKYQLLSDDHKMFINDLKLDVKSRIDDYILNFNTIKEIAANIKDLKGENIFEELKKRYFDSFVAEFFNDSLKDIIDEYGATIEKELLEKIELFIEKLNKLNKIIDGIPVKRTEIDENIALINNLINANNKSTDKWKEEAKTIIDQYASLNEVKQTIDAIKENISTIKDNDDYKQLSLFETEIESDIETEIEINITPESNSQTDALEAIKAWLNEEKNKLVEFAGNLNNLKKEILELKREIASKLQKKDILDLLLKNFEHKIDSTNIVINQTDTLSVKKIGEFTRDLYTKIVDLRNKDRISIKDIKDLQDNIIPKIIELKILSPDTAETLKKWSSDIKQIISFLNIEAIEQIADQKLTKEQIEQIKYLLKFLSNLDNLDKAETFEHVINLFREGNEIINQNLEDGEFKNIYNLFSNAIKKYTLVNTKEQYIEVDVASFLVELEGYYDKNNTANWGFYLGIGLSQNFFLRDVPLSESEEASRTVGFASEKLGVKYKILNFKRASDYTNVVPNDIYLSNRSPFINEWYANLYGSGLLYSLANSTTNENFDFAHVGLGTGIRFYNALDFSVNIGFPLGENSKPFKDAFVGFGFDIPLSEYLSRSRTKRSKAKED